MKINKLTFLAIILASSMNTMAKDKNEKLLEKLKNPIHQELEMNLMIDIFKNKVVKDKSNWSGHPEFLWRQHELYENNHQLWLFYKKQVAGALIHSCGSTTTTFRMYAFGAQVFTLSDTTLNLLNSKVCSNVPQYIRRH